MSITNDDIKADWELSDAIEVTMDADGTDGDGSDGDGTDGTDGTDGDDGDGGDA